jgi:hypothetical protein
MLSLPSQTGSSSPSSEWLPLLMAENEERNGRGETRKRRKIELRKFGRPS